MTPLRHRLGWLRTDTRRQYVTAVLLYKILNFSSPSYLCDMFEKRQSSRPARGTTRDLTIPQVNFENGRFELQVCDCGIPCHGALKVYRV